MVPVFIESFTSYCCSRIADICKSYSSAPVYMAFQVMLCRQPKYVTGFWKITLMGAFCTLNI